ncbi:unnamed protein product, partial [Ixodes hexagonus]
MPQKCPVYKLSLSLVPNSFRTCQREVKDLVRGAIQGYLKPGQESHKKVINVISKIEKQFQDFLPNVNKTKDAAYSLLRSNQFSPGELLRDAANLDLPAFQIALDVV